jgi:hypothetical protein
VNANAKDWAIPGFNAPDMAAVNFSKTERVID